MPAPGLAWVLAFALLSPPSSAATAGRAPGVPTVHVVVIENMRFIPATLELRDGDIVEWQNRDMVQHTATARDGGFDVDLVPGATARTVVARGTIAVYCRYHPNMAATLVVD
jgi:plastocyanin